MKWFINFILGLFGIGRTEKIKWKKACARIECAMMTPIFAYKDFNQLKSQCKALDTSPNFNSVCGLLDQQDRYGRGIFGQPDCYIIKVRNKTSLTKEGVKNLEGVLNCGITPVVITHNDHQAQKAADGTFIPSLQGGKPARLKDFYSAEILASEKIFLNSLKKYFPYIHIQLTIEATAVEAIPFNLEIAKYLRDIGFKNKIIMNPLGDANEAYKAIRNQFDALNVVRAQSHHSTTPPSDPIWNTDGYKHPNQSNAKDWISLFRASGKEYIFHTQELKNCPNGIPIGYL